MSPFMKGALGFLGCAGIFGAAYAIGKHVGREETLKEVEMEEKQIAAQQSEPVVAPVSEPAKTIVPLNEAAEASLAVQSAPQPTPAEMVRKKHGLKNKFFGGTTSVIKDLLGNPDGKKLVVTVEDGDVVARISQKNSA